VLSPLVPEMVARTMYDKLPYISSSCEPGKSAEPDLSRLAGRAGGCLLGEVSPGRSASDHAHIPEALTTVA